MENWFRKLGSFLYGFVFSGVLMRDTGDLHSGNGFDLGKICFFCVCAARSENLQSRQTSLHIERSLYLSCEHKL